MDPSTEPQLTGDSPGGLDVGFLVGAGRYTLIRLLGQGSNGAVWLALDEQLGEEVALKFIAGPLTSNLARMDGLRRQIAKTRKLSHPSLVRIFDFYHAHDEPTFISVESVAGGNFDELRRQQPHRVFSWLVLQPFILELCRALAYAHGEGLTHGGIKPSNLMMDERGRLKVADFGLAVREVRDLETAAVPAGSGQGGGAICFLSPQVLDGADASVADDIYALGATLYELLCGSPPFRWDVAFRARKVRPQGITERITEIGAPTDLPPHVAALIMACLAKEPDQRPKSAQEVIEGIDLTVGDQTPSVSLVLASADTNETSELGQTGPALETVTLDPVPGVGMEGVSDPEADAGEPPRGQPPRIQTRLVGWLVVAATVAALFWGWRFFNARGSRGRVGTASPRETAVSGGQAVVPAVPVAPLDPEGRSNDEARSIAPTPPVLTLSGHRQVVNSVAFVGADGEVASGSFDSTVRLWNRHTGEFLRALTGHQDQVKSVAFSPVGGTLASASQDRTVRLWDVVSGETRSTLAGMESTVFMVAFAPDGKLLASAEENGVISIWDPATGTRRKNFKAHDGAVWSIAFSTDGRTLASGGVDGRVRLWNVTSGAPLQTLSGHTEAVHSVAFSPDGATLASSGRDRTIRLWRLADGKPARQWSTGDTIGHALAFARRGNGLVSANEDGSIGVWAAGSGRLLTNLVGHSGVVHSVAFAPDGRTLASGGHDGTAKLWDWDRVAKGFPELDEFTELFNGRDLTGWSGNLRYWSVQDGILVGAAPQGDKLKTFLVWTGGTVGDFELRFVFRSAEGNSGVLFRAPEPQADQLEGYQYELWSDQTGGLIDVRNNGERRNLALLGQRTVATDSRGIRLVHVVETFAKPKVIPWTTSDEGWNEGVIIAQGNRITQRLNGLASAMVLDLDSTRALVQGALALELYSEGERPRTIQFKSVRLRRF